MTTSPHVLVCEHKGPDRVALRTPEDVATFARPLFPTPHQESVLVVLVNSKNRATWHALVCLGTLSASLIHPREVFRLAIEKSAAAFFVVHNHPSGVATPSQEDLAITKRLRRTSEIVGIELLDHVIVGEDSHQSLRELEGWS